MPKKIDPGVEGAGGADGAGASAGLPVGDRGLAQAVAKQLGLGRETVRRWVVQAEVDAGARPG